MNNFKFQCDVCDYKTNAKQNYNKHLLTKKHIQRQTPIEPQIHNINNDLLCNVCSKSYKCRSGLWSHKKRCIVKPTTNEKKLNIVKELQKDIQIIKALLMEKSTKQPDNQLDLQPVNHTNISVENQYTTTTNTTNNNFNINIFLEGCKDAINYVDFIESLRGSISITNIQNIGNHGYVKGYTLNIVDKLRKFPLYQRPIHYHEPEETIYIRDDNEWKSNKNEIKEIMNGTTFTIDRITRCKISGLRNITDKNFEKEMEEINIHGGLSRENTEEQTDILNNIIKHIKVP
jgi:hypothetical protein